jgi:hypothetical protein
VARKIYKEDLKVEYDNLLKEWVVWERVGTSAYNQTYSAKTKKECMNWIEKNAKSREVL